MEKSINKIVLEIRAGTGGEEAALFAADLVRMYEKYALSQNWQFTVTDSSQSDEGGYKTFAAEIKGRGVYDALRSESGVHRVQRIPKTESGGRIHTSTASVVVIPLVPQEEVRLNPSDLEISFARSSGPGGQNANKVETSVRIVHKPTGLTVTSQAERSQARNRERAENMLRAKLYEMQQEEQQAELSSTRKEQIGGSERAEKIRTYNFPQNRVTDHRLGKKWQQLDKIMNGQLDPIVRAFSQRA